MGLAIALGSRNLGLTWPNPSVGAVLVETGAVPRILAQGATRPGGRPHAEIVALDRVGQAARGATLYVSLEPCSHHGKTAPCADAIVAAGIARVVSAISDPDPRVAGRGYAILRAAGIALTTCIRESEAARSHHGHISRVVRGRPWVTGKLARTRDGYAGCSGARLKITGEGADAVTHMLRAHADAILVGASTIAADDPRLDVRLPGLDGRRPVRIVFDSELRTPPEAHVIATAGSQPTWCVCTEAAPPAHEARLVAAGAVVIRVAADRVGRVDPAAALQEIGRRGITRLFCEGGPTLAEALAGADLLDEIVLMTGPAHFAADPSSGLRALGPILAGALETRFRVVQAQDAGLDRIETFERIAPCLPGS